MYGIPARRVRFIHNDHTPRTDVIVADDAEASYRAIWHALRTDRERWDVLLLGQLERDSKTHAGFPGVCRGRASAHRHVAQQRFAVPADHRHLGRLSQQPAGEVPLEPAQPAVTPDARSASLSLEDPDRPAGDRGGRAKKPGGSKAPGGSAKRARRSPPTRRCNASTPRSSSAGTSAGWLRLLFLTVGGPPDRHVVRRLLRQPAVPVQDRLRPGVRHRARRSSSSRTSPSSDACARGLAEVDFLGDAEPWKLEWTSTSRGHDWLYRLRRHDASPAFAFDQVPVAAGVEAMVESSVTA